MRLCQLAHFAAVELDEKVVGQRPADDQRALSIVVRQRGDLGGNVIGEVRVQPHAVQTDAVFDLEERLLRIGFADDELVAVGDDQQTLAGAKAAEERGARPSLAAIEHAGGRRDSARCRRRAWRHRRSNACCRGSSD